MPNNDEPVIEDGLKRILFTIGINAFRRNEIHDLPVEEADWYINTRSAFEVDTETNEVIITERPAPVETGRRNKPVKKTNLGEEVIKIVAPQPDKPMAEPTPEPVKKTTRKIKSTEEKPSLDGEAPVDAPKPKRVQRSPNFDDLAAGGS